MLRRLLVVALAVFGLLCLTSNPAAAGLLNIFSVDCSEEGAEVVVLDIPLFTLLEVEKEDSEGELVIFKTPLITMLHTEKDDGEASCELLDLPLITVFQCEREGDDESELEILTLPILGSLFRCEKENGASEVEILFFIEFEREDED
ncbi:hypothetical protein AMJ85_04295 [candidate division BRC1 bacterium SM23_51]|nr:MAG: hypothetical protein AMJ85_04295 [candidate division BRC1 bacterium SM23_51]